MPGQSLEADGQATPVSSSLRQRKDGSANTPFSALEFPAPCSWVESGGHSQPLQREGQYCLFGHSYPVFLSTCPGDCGGNGTTVTICDPAAYWPPGDKTQDQQGGLPCRKALRFWNYMSPHCNLIYPNTQRVPTSVSENIH